MSAEMTQRGTGGGTQHGRMPYRDLRQEESINPGVRRRQRLASWKTVPESLNFTVEENEVWRTKQAQLQYTNRNRWWTSSTSTTFKRWVLTMVVGVLTGVVGIFITYFTQYFTRIKFAAVRDVMDREAAGELARGAAFFP